MGSSNRLNNPASDSWDSLKSLFEALNSSVTYCVLRNFDSLSIGIIEDDVDILVDDFEKFISVSRARKIMKREAGWAITISEHDVRFDVRTPNDQYYDSDWAQNILSQRVMDRGIFIPDEENFRYSLLYHILIHKKHIDRKYCNFLSNEFNMIVNNGPEFIDEYGRAELLEKLDNFLVEKKYFSSIPHERGYYLIMNLENIRCLTLFDDQPKCHRFLYFVFQIYNRMTFLKYIYNNFVGNRIKMYVRAKFFDSE